MYIEFKQGVCSECREQTNKIELEKWKREHPNIPTTWDGYQC